MSTIDRSVPQMPDIPEVFTPEDYLEARALERYIDGIAVNIGLPTDDHGKEHSLDTSEDVSMLQIPESPELTKQIETLLETIEKTCEEVSGTVVSPVENESESFIGTNARKDFRLKPFNQQLRYLCSRYIVESVERALLYSQDSEHAWKNAVGDVTSLLKSVPNLSRDVYEKHIPAYTVLYDEFDKLKKDGSYPVEIYLGRDGIYAYHGRIAQNAARGDNDPDTNSYPLSDDDLIVREDPRYIVYSRGVMASGDKDRKRDYIRQFVDDSDDVHFYDTGYAGSIPEDIMNILGFSKEEISRRIHLLNTDNDERRLSGIPPEWDIVTIEDGPKTEHSAFGLSRDGGIIKHQTEPTSLEAQFKFLVVRNILLRHFWMKEYVEITEDLGGVVFGNSTK